MHPFGAYLGHPFKTTDLLFSKKKQTQTLILGPVKFPNCMWLFLDFLIPVWFKGFLNQQEQLSPWSQAWCVSLTVERTWIQGGAEVINGTSVTAQSVVALLCRGKLTNLLQSFIFCPLPHTRWNTRADFIFARHQKCRNAHGAAGPVPDAVFV